MAGAIKRQFKVTKAKKLGEHAPRPKGVGWEVVKYMGGGKEPQSVQWVRHVAEIHTGEE